MLQVLVDNDNYEMWALKPEKLSLDKSLHFATRNEAIYAKKIIESWLVHSMEEALRYDTKSIIESNQI